MWLVTRATSGETPHRQADKVSGGGGFGGGKKREGHREDYDNDKKGGKVEYVQGQNHALEKKGGTSGKPPSSVGCPSIDREVKMRGEEKRT